MSGKKKSHTARSQLIHGRRLQASAAREEHGAQLQRGAPAMAVHQEVPGQDSGHRGTQVETCHFFGAGFTGFHEENIRKPWILHDFTRKH